MRWADAEFAAAQTREAYQRMLRAGTLGYAAFLTSHFHGYECAVRAGHVLPLRGYVGQVMMDRHGPSQLLGHPLTRIALVGFSFAFVYHLLNGVRHLVWDTGHGFEKKQARASGWLAFLGAIVLTAFLWFLIARGGAA